MTENNREEKASTAIPNKITVFNQTAWDAEDSPKNIDIFFSLGLDEYRIKINKWIGLNNKGKHQEQFVDFKSIVKTETVRYWLVSLIDPFLLESYRIKKSYVVWDLYTEALAFTNLYLTSLKSNLQKLKTKTEKRKDFGKSKKKRREI